MPKKYYTLAKPGIIYGNIITTIAAFLFACRWHFTMPVLWLFLATVIGLSLVIASGCVFNNIIDRDIDRKMERTKKRALVTGEITIRSAQVYGLILGIVGFVMLALFVNALSAVLALLGFVMYVVVYGYAKRKSEWGALVGTIPGAVPIVVGYTAYTNHFNLASLLLFLAMVAWQMPHFYAIAIYKMDEYMQAGIPVFPARKGVKTTAAYMLFFMAAFYATTVALFFYADAGLWYGLLMLATNLFWFWRGFAILRNKPMADTAKVYAPWARRVFFGSLIVLLVFCVALSLQF